jgi:putative FmdB family regulatory protein
MPIYAFQCAECGHSFDRLQKMSDPDPETCPSCGAHQVKRQLTAPSFRLSGSGWYETDFKKDGDKRRGQDRNQNRWRCQAGSHRNGERAEDREQDRSQACTACSCAFVVAFLFFFDLKQSFSEPASFRTWANPKAVIPAKAGIQGRALLQLGVVPFSSREK